ncbi:hypothetical protein HII36_14585 [Nonomuraea sp. NN258]|uniref:hypothetical protein n=1 Tax=Nonomuraea antri TaxID=2730852 RepID=UPI0015680359|nr:hypothetical protein [Nonomuraea antri]NRQ33058.1 hypothetical protein [Nonomuraea antri]
MGSAATGDSDADTGEAGACEADPRGTAVSGVSAGTDEAGAADGAVIGPATASS